MACKYIIYMYFIIFTTNVSRQIRPCERRRVGVELNKSHKAVYHRVMFGQFYASIRFFYASLVLGFQV